MYRKNNPWLSLVALVLLALILVFICTGCTTEASAAENHRFTIDPDGYNNGLSAYVITDTETGQQYLFVDVPNGGAMVKLED